MSLEEPYSGENNRSLRVAYCKDSPNLPCDALQGGSFIEDMIIIYVTLDVKRRSCTRRNTLYNGTCIMQNIISDNLQPLTALFSPVVRSKWCTSANRIFLPTPLTSLLPTPFASFFTTTTARLITSTRVCITAKIE